MDGSQSTSGSNAPAPFLLKTYDMVDDPFTNSVISWSHTGRSFVVWNPPEFAQDFLPKYFKHNNFSSFVRQLNTYGFRKVDPDQWEFANEEFMRGQRHLLKNIYRRKPIHSHSLQNLQGNTSPLTETERQEFEKQIKRLKQDKSLLQLELQRNEREKQEFEYQIESLGERLRVMDSRQVQLMSFLAQLMRRPGFASILMQQTNKKRRLLNDDNFKFNGRFNLKDDQLLAASKEGHPPQILNYEVIDPLDSSLKFWEDFVGEVGESLGKVYDFGVKAQPSPPINVREVSGSSAEEEMWSPMSHPSSPMSRENPSSSSSSPELAGCIIPYVVDIPTPPDRSYNIDVDIRADDESSLLDVNVKPASASGLDQAVKEAVLEMSTSPPPDPAGANDHFWQNFLTEAPASLMN
ncbi:hypothetical protein Tsubulata_041993 [Turnera subulata]|uniref:HSF-type DNA-binding domain-containing protein n=1 Tax=Turnera subulata TaxID=218843 RepID=A0A9Q0GDW0_9ROSI|nr:hypothetical protein Tsubulata_041993 [Turnera subulata]